MTAPSIHGILPDAVELTNRVARTYARAIKFLPAPVRDHVYLLYYVCRVLDDLVDYRQPGARERLQAVRAWVLTGGPVVGKEEAVLEHLLQRYPDIPRDAIVDF